MFVTDFVKIRQLGHMSCAFPCIFTHTHTHTHTHTRDEKLREDRKKNHGEAKRIYQTEIKKEKLNSWKEYCNVPASTNPWSQVYKLAAGKIRPKSTITTLTKQDGTERRNTKETMEVLLDYLFEEDSTEENQYQKQIRKAVEEPIKTIDDIEF